MSKESIVYFWIFRECASILLLCRLFQAFGKNCAWGSCWGRLRFGLGGRPSLCTFFIAVSVIIVFARIFNGPPYSRRYFRSTGLGSPRGSWPGLLVRIWDWEMTAFCWESSWGWTFCCCVDALLASLFSPNGQKTRFLLVWDYVCLQEYSCPFRWGLTWWGWSFVSFVWYPVRSFCSRLCSSSSVERWRVGFLSTRLSCEGRFVFEQFS